MNHFAIVASIRVMRTCECLKKSAYWEYEERGERKGERERERKRGRMKDVRERKKEKERERNLKMVS